MSAIPATAHRPTHKAESAPPPPMDPKTIAFVIAGGCAVIVMVGLIALELFHLIKDISAEYFDKRSIAELKVKVRQHLTGELAKLVDIVDKLETSPKRLLRRMEMTHQDEKKFLMYIIENFEIDEHALKEILRGAHVRLDDNGEAYNKWEREFKAKNARISSHPSERTQYGMQGALVKELLFGQNKNNTWFQLENHPTSLGHVIRHSFDYVRYNVYKTNQGPYGESNFKDNNPLVLKKRLSKA